MEQKKIGLFLKQLRKEKQLTQEALAEQLHVSGRTVSRWETGYNMPDISLLVELAEFYCVSIPEIIDGERKSETMQEETKETAIKLAEYSKNEVKTAKRRVISTLICLFGVFIILSALAIFPHESSWGSIYSVIGGIIFVAGIYCKAGPAFAKKRWRILLAVGCSILLFGVFTLSDYITVSQFHQVPRFSYQKTYGENEVEHTTLFFTVIQKNPGTENEKIDFVQ